MSLEKYRARRDFQRTAEPSGATGDESDALELAFIVQKHAASRLHYDLRLEWNGVLLSWAVPKGPSYDPGQRRLAVQVEDHPLSYAQFEGTIPKGEYGGGTVMLWDRGRWEPLEDPQRGLHEGNLKFRLYGEKLQGGWALVRMQEPNWLLIKERDDYVRKQADYDVTGLDRSVASGRSLAEIAGAISVPDKISPQLASSTGAAPEGDDWLHEIKYDGYRLLARVGDREARLFTRGDQDWTGRYPAIAEAAAKMPAGSFLDGEIVWLDEHGRSHFAGIQKGHLAEHADSLIYYLFDAPFLAGEDLRALPLEERKRRLQAALPETGPLRYSAHVRGQGPEVLEQACRLGLEGIVSKRADSPYASRRTRTWLKCKCPRQQEFLVLGYTAGKQELASLLLGQQTPQGLAYAGKVGTGMSQALLARLLRELRSLPAGQAPAGAPRLKLAHWVDPQLRARVRFADWTENGIIRQASFLDWRKPETSVKISNRKRVIDPESGTSKGDLADYYEAAADWLLPHIADRPLTLIRCPDGVQGQCFYQKHLGPGYNSEVHPFQDDDDTYLSVNSRAGLLSLIQMGAIELHPWGSRVDDRERPDRLIFDLDPDQGLSWDKVIGATLEIRRRLSELGLESFCKTTGGKGLHVVVPLIPQAGWAEAKAFCKAIAEAMASDTPRAYVSVSSKAQRKGRLFIDYLRNGRGQTAVSAYSVRARAHCPVSLPLAWEEVGDSLDPSRYRLPLLPPPNPWPDLDSLRQALTPTILKKLRIETP